MENLNLTIIITIITNTKNQTNRIKSMKRLKIKYRKAKKYFQVKFLQLMLIHSIMHLPPSKSTKKLKQNIIINNLIPKVKRVKRVKRLRIVKMMVN